MSNFSQKVKGYFTTKRITTIAVMVALNVVANVYTYNIGNIQNFSITQSTCFISGILLGPISGFLCGFLGDLFGWLIQPKGPYFPLISVGTGLLGLIPGLLFFLFKFIFKRPVNLVWSIVLTVLSFILCYFLVTCLVNSFAFWYYLTSHKKTFWVYTTARALKQLPPTVLNFIICVGLGASLVSIPFFKENFYVYKPNNNEQDYVEYDSHTTTDNK